MAFIIKGCQFLTWFLVLLYMVTGQQVNNNSSNNTYTGFIPGSSPANPTKTFTLCQSQARSRPYNTSYSGTLAGQIQNWCSKYEDILPCLNRNLPASNDNTDWLLKLVLDQSRAARMSRSMCMRFPFISNLTCADEGVEAARQCMEWTTKTSVERFYSQFIPGQPFTQSNKRMASIYGCITTVATAGCFHKYLTACSSPQRKLIYDFYIMFSGKCREVAGLPDPPTTPSPINLPNTDVMKPNKDRIGVEDTKLSTALQSELDNKDTSRPPTHSNVTGPQFTGNGRTTVGTTWSIRAQQYDGSNGQSSQQHVFSCWTMLMLVLLTIIV